MFQSDHIIVKLGWQFQFLTLVIGLSTEEDMVALVLTLLFDQVLGPRCRNQYWTPEDPELLSNKKKKCYKWSGTNSSTRLFVSSLFLSCVAGTRRPSRCTRWCRWASRTRAGAATATSGTKRSTRTRPWPTGRACSTGSRSWATGTAGPRRQTAGNPKLSTLSYLSLFVSYDALV